MSAIIFCFFFNDTATTEIYTLSLHDALPISVSGIARSSGRTGVIWLDAHADFNIPETSPSGNIHGMPLSALTGRGQDRKSTRLNSSHANISYAVFCLKKNITIQRRLSDELHR